MKEIGVAMDSARTGNRPIPHMLLAGAAGCGKTTTARYLAEITGARFITVSSDTIKGRADLLPILEVLDREGYDKNGNITSIITPAIIFIDEIHNLSVGGQEVLGIMMEEWYVPVSENISVDKQLKEDPNVKTIKMANRWCPRFTLIGATTNDGKLSKPFRDRFKMRFNFSTYSIEESMEIVQAHAKRLKILIDDDAVTEIAKRGRGVPRVLVRYLESCRDFSVVHKTDRINFNVTRMAFHTMGVDKIGLTRTDIKILKSLYEFEKPLGIDNLSIQLNESPKVIVEAIEPFLIQSELMVRSARGRLLTSKGRRYLIAEGHITYLEPEYYDKPVDVEYYNKK
jgi:Holliday junction DNA helicase RuvB